MASDPIRALARQTMDSKPPVDKSQLRVVAEFYQITVDQVTVAHIAFFKQATEAMKGDQSAFEFLQRQTEEPTESGKSGGRAKKKVSSTFRVGAVDGEE